jgi:hypothetical protein
LELGCGHQGLFGGHGEIQSLRFKIMGSEALSMLIGAQIFIIIADKNHNHHNHHENLRSKLNFRRRRETKVISLKINGLLWENS